MNENDWTTEICKKLNGDLKSQGLCAETLKDIAYSQEIDGYKKNEDKIAWRAVTSAPICFQTDLVIYEEKDIIKPRVIIESKTKSVTTHDAITYSCKAEKHKFITPYIRYGIMIGDRGDCALPGRLFRHGLNFDFMFSFREKEPSTDEWIIFTQMIYREVEYSRNLEKILHQSRKKERDHYFMFEKQLVLKEVQDRQ